MQEQVIKIIDEIGKELAQIWGATFLKWYFKDNKFIFECKEGNEYFYTDLSFEDVHNRINNKINN